MTRAGLVVLLLLAGCSANRPQAGTGDVAFRLVWEGISDLDLAVQDPSGECVAFISRHSKSGGVLDVDCNGGTGLLCERPIENVYWPANTAPAGDYRFWVRAHSLIPAESPLAFRLQLLRGKSVFWLHQGSLDKSDESYGPFVYTLPSGKVAGPIKESDSSRSSCGLMVFGQHPVPDFDPAPQ
jgi:hypothetical protein